MFLINKRKPFLDVARLVKITTKIEADLERLGGSGNGIYEKYSSISHKFPKDFEKILIELAEARNRAVHDSPEINNKERLFNQGEVLSKIILWREKTEHYSEEMRSILAHKTLCEHDEWSRYDKVYKEMIDTLYNMESDSRKYTFKECENFIHDHFYKISPRIKTINKFIKLKCLIKRPIFWGILLLLSGICIWYVGR